jgi:hypothetical protein
MIARLLARGSDVNATNHRGVTALLVCVWHRQSPSQPTNKHGAAKVRQRTAAWHNFAQAGTTPLDVANNQLHNQSGAKPWRDPASLLR